MFFLTGMKMEMIFLSSEYTFHIGWEVGVMIGSLSNGEVGCLCTNTPGLTDL